jgi:hypothetical protein
MGVIQQRHGGMLRYWSNHASVSKPFGRFRKACLVVLLGTAAHFVACQVSRVVEQSAAISAFYLLSLVSSLYWRQPEAECSMGSCVQKC